MYKKVGRGFGVGSADVGRAFSAKGVWLRVRLHSTSDTAASDIVLGIDAISTRTRWIISILFTRFSIFTSTSQALDVHFRSHTLTVRGM